MADMWLRDKMDAERVARHQAERYTVLRDVAALAAVGREPTQRDYVTYHCFMFIAGRKTMSYDELVALLLGESDGVASALLGGVHGDAET